MPRSSLIPADPRIRIALMVALVALVIGLVVIWFGSREDAGPGPGGLVVETGVKGEGKLDPKATLKCFVNGQSVGEATLADCARRNGVAPGALDVGLDASGNLAASDAGVTVLTPIPPTSEGAETAPLAPEPDAKPETTLNMCARGTGGEETRLSGDMTLNACVQALFNGHCERPGGTSFGHWGNQTLRLEPGRVEISGDGKVFRHLADQSSSCAVGPLDVG